MVNREHATHPKPQGERKHPERYEADLNPERGGGQSSGEGPIYEKPGVKTAAEIASLTRMLQDFSSEELRHIPVLPHGARLEQGATYVNLADPSRRTFTADGVMRVAPNDLLVAKSGMPYNLWNRLIGIRDPTRTT